MNNNILKNMENKKNNDKNEDDFFEKDEEIVIGIDLGTRFSCVSVWRNKRFEVIPDQFGNRTIPSVVSFYKSAKLVGNNALAMKDINPKNTIFNIKKIIGKRIDDPKIEEIKKLITYELTDDQSKHRNILIKLDEADTNISRKKLYKPEEICAQILIEIKRMAENYLKKKVEKAVITVPAYFNDAQRQATLDSAKIAGLNVLRIINEPTAASLTYGLGSKSWSSKNGGNVIIYDFGAGTLDISLMNINNGLFRTLAMTGNSYLGGEDIDYEIMNFVINDFKKKNKIKSLEINKLSLLKLKNSVENAKKILSTVDKAVICVDDFYNNKRIYYALTRQIFEMICNNIFIMALRPLKQILESANLSRDDIDDVILVGGSTRIPKIQELILGFFKNTKIKKLTSSLNPDEVVSAGASIYGYIMTHKEDPFSENLVLLDITPLSLGVETLQKQMTTIIPRNTVIPTKKTKMFSTDTDYQDTVSIKIFEGERKLTRHNFHVGTFELSGFEKGPCGYPTIKITFHIDVNGILQVTAHEKKSGVENSIQITSTWGAKGRLSRQEIDQIIQQAEKNDDIDKICSMKIGLVHNINSICNSVLINLKENAFSLTNSDKIKIRRDVKSNLKWLNNKDFNELDFDELEKREKRLSKTYAPLIARVNKNNNNFKDGNACLNAAEVHGDDDDNESLELYEKIEIPNDPSEYDKEEIKALKKTISDLCKNIISVVNNPISKFAEQDIQLVVDYLESVQIWLYTTNSTTSIEFIAKINEINKFTEDMMKKYEEIKVFEKNEKFTLRDELQLTCLTLNTSIKSNYFSLEKNEINKLTNKINEIMVWLLDHQKEQDSIYQDKLDEISELCNGIYHNTHKFQIFKNTGEEQNYDNSDSDSNIDEEENDDEIICQTNKINENIDDILLNLPDEIISKPKNNENDVLLKIDLTKLNSNKKIKYKNIEHN
ncbi:hsp 70-like protein [Moumouvirus maliensis]|nr:hsp 70-like protein [Moumouvirus maliensis]